MIHSKALKDRLKQARQSYKSDNDIKEHIELKKSWTKVFKNTNVQIDNFKEENVFRTDVEKLSHDVNAEVFLIKGPLGRGLQIEETGVHVAFCGGTGLLVFIDLVTHLIVRNIWRSYHEPEDWPDAVKQVDSKFKFILFVSVPDMGYVCGLDICEALVKVNRRLGYSNFKLVVRVSKRHDKKRDESWNAMYVDTRLKPYAGEIKRVWVSGPPPMNESLDKAFEFLGPRLKIHHT